MFCLSSLLCDVWSRHASDYEQRSGCQLIFVTNPLVPEYIHASEEDFLSLLSGAYTVLSGVVTKNTQTVMRVTSVKDIANFATLRFELSFESSSSLQEVQAVLGPVINGLDHQGAWVQVIENDCGAFTFKFELTVKAVVPSETTSLPSWLYGRHVAFLRQEVRQPMLGSVEMAMLETGGLVRSFSWGEGPAQGMTNLNTDFQYSSAALFVIGFDDLQLSAAELNAHLKDMIHTGLTAGQKDLLFTVTPKQYDMISLALRIQLGPRLVRTPITIHRLCNPRHMLLYADYNSRLQVPSSEYGELTVMVVEDCELTRKLISQYLIQKGTRVVEAANGDEAVKLAVTESLDAVIMDLKLPIMNGCDAAAVMRSYAELKNLPIIGITSSKSHDDYVRTFEVGMNECICKPLNFSEILNKLHAWIHERQVAKNAKLLKQEKATH